MTAPLVVLRPEDAGRMALLHMESFDDPWSASSLRGLLLQPGILALGIEAGDRLAAFVLAQSVAGEADILTVATHPEERRKGHGRALVSAMVRRLGERGIGRITLDVAEDNGPARALYESQGFKVDGRRPKYYRKGRGEPVDAILMSRQLKI